MTASAWKRWIPVLAVGCGRGGPAELRGTFEVVSRIADGREIGRDEVGVGSATDAAWGREIWKFSRGQLTVERDVLLPSTDGGYTACEVDVTVAAAWNGPMLTIPYGARGRSRARTRDGSDRELAGCDVSIEAGEWRIGAERSPAWDSVLEDGATGGKLRLKQANDNPDYRSRVPAAAPVASTLPGGR